MWVRSSCSRSRSIARLCPIIPHRRAAAVLRDMITPAQSVGRDGGSLGSFEGPSEVAARFSLDPADLPLCSCGLRQIVATAPPAGTPLVRAGERARYQCTGG